MRRTKNETVSSQTARAIRRKAGTDLTWPQNFMEGLRVERTGQQGLKVFPGRAYVPGLGRVVELKQEGLAGGISMTSAGWRHVYLRANDKGDGEIEVVNDTNGPPEEVPYYGQARTREGDNTERLLDTFRVWEATPGNFEFPRRRRLGDFVLYIEDFAGRVVATRAASGDPVSATFSVSTWVPEYVRQVEIAMQAQSGGVAGSVYYGHPADALNPVSGLGQYQLFVPSTTGTRMRYIGPVEIDDSRQMRYRVDDASILTTAWVMGYYQELS